MQACEVKGTPLFERTIAFDCGDEARNALMQKVWSATPWMVDVVTDGINSERERDINEFCRATFGDEAWPIHGRTGEWQRGSATVHGHTWYGFRTAEQLELFLETFPHGAAKDAAHD